MKKIILMSVFVCFVVCCGFFAKAAGILDEKQKEISALPEAYQELGVGCLKAGSFNCCMVSVKDMVKGDYRPADFKTYKDGCPLGFQRDMLKCEDSYSWCVPNAQDDEKKENR